MYVKIDKDAFEAVMLTKKLKIVGKVYMLPQERLTDFMLSSSATTYLPVTDATIYNLDSGALIAKTSFLSLSKHEVTAIFPAADLVE